MTFIRSAAVLIAVISLFTVAATAQKRKPAPRKYPPTPKVVTTNTATTSVGDVAKAKETVNNQIKNVTKFVDVLGPIAQGIESVDKDAKTKKVDKKTLDMNAANKQKVIQAIVNLRAGLTALETDFTNKPALRKFLLKIQGIAALSAQSEDLAKANRFTDSGKPLLSVIEKLTDTLSAMP
ncbi:MAG TPA: hypothetical protein VL325_07955 [Pyrinomonadaceae bacterium]|nr:hypothetical protein [Pyrinomonadaceae bacterium]